VREMEALWPSGVGPAGAGVKPPRAALAEDCRGERPGKRRGLTASGGDQEDVPESVQPDSRWGVRCRGVESDSDGIKTGGPDSPSGMSLADTRVAGQAVPGVEAA
jgi:hypothetical protein